MKESIALDLEVIYNEALLTSNDTLLIACRVWDFTYL